MINKLNIIQKGDRYKFIKNKSSNINISEIKIKKK